MYTCKINKIELTPDHIPSWLAEIQTARSFSPERMAVLRRSSELALAHLQPAQLHLLTKGLSVAATLSSLRLDSDSLAAAIIFPAVHEAELSLLLVAEKISPEVAKLIDGVIKMDAIRGLSNPNLPNAAPDSIQVDRWRKMLLVMAEDVRVVLIRLAEHLRDLQLAKNWPEDERVSLARETQSIYAPLANRLGVGQLKWELEDLAFRYLEPGAYQYIASLLAEKRRDRELYIDQVVTELRAELQAQDIKAEVVGRPKHIYSIWRKMRRKNLDYDQIYDIRAVRILTEQVRDCYAILGIVHSLWSPLRQEFDDYIATPKENGYQSLHTAVIGPQGKTIEVQIRTQDMHTDSEFGVAAHWRYKENVKHDTHFEQKIAWLRELISWQSEMADANELFEEFRTDILEERVYALTPSGEVLDLPEESTPLDFAYQIHTEIGHKCRGAKINGKLVPLTYRLQTGDQVEILTVKNATPSRDWLNPNLRYIKTARARAKIYSWFKKQDYLPNLQAGREILARELKCLNLEPIDLEKISTELNFKSGDDLLAALGCGDVKMSQILNSVKASGDSKNLELASIPTTNKVYKNYRETGIEVDGVDNLLTTLARCCKPIPGDTIVGYITQGRGITIHREDCPNILYLSANKKERSLNLTWGKNTDRTKVYPVDLFILAQDRQGLLRDITGILSMEKINVSSLDTKTLKNDTVHMFIGLEIPALDSLGKIFHQLNCLTSILEVKRISHRGGV